MNMVSIIEKKKLGQELTENELTFFADAAAASAKGKPTVPDYQLSALLMAIRLNGMSQREISQLTLAMLHTGDIADLSPIPGVKVDKHSTGGVGDTTTLVLAPLAASCGIPVAKMSGRGLGHTGGTLDKLESISGLTVSLDEERFIHQVQDIGIAVIGQTGDLAPADKALYALRDVTSTVDSIPLVASSIMSKKLASGADAIVLDVKTGSGAVMHTLEESKQLARTMVEIGKAAGKKMCAIVTGMDQPLGTHVGNALEVKEAIDLLSCRTQGDLLEVSLLLGSKMLMLAGKVSSEEEARAMLMDKLHSGEGLRKFAQMIKAQGGNPDVCRDVSLLPQPNVIRHVKCGKSGYVQKMNTTLLGEAAQRMGAGRLTKSDIIDFSVGFILPVRIGDYVENETEQCTLYGKSEESCDRAEEEIRSIVQISSEKPEKPPLWYAVID